MKLYIGNKNYSSWSLRAWLIMDKLNISFEEVKLQLFTDAFYNELEGISETRKVPALVDGKLHIWESLAIAEYISEVYCSGKGWPQDRFQRARARAISQEMATGFFALRSEAPMNIRAKRKLEFSEAAQKDIARIEQIFTNQMQTFAGRGNWLFGSWSIADAMYAPVLLRFKTYGVALSTTAQLYMEHALQCPSLQKWIAAALLETDILVEDEAGIEAEANSNN